MNNQKGFTLIEMLIVLAVISILMLLFIPNLADKGDTINSKGCDALLQMTENQIASYELEEGEEPETLQMLVDNEYLETTECANGKKEITKNTSGELTISNKND
ncbi:competence type IV pilus major pilin ComGC [Gracilibacillus salinarum]|uniref:ComG operon protein 3 n=1 Tax=Gracilibacillus salinarum TaxID=2932255 RepID=A0ABY4GQP5_9BACI|nr:competence type IV pilus major pilin ComGC [Gracilibacillus salinarum]UOQ85997.1 prepilin-type N-terminal cleavage/methylation domain-containing protein [Gracilibacillus salinarum]